MAGSPKSGEAGAPANRAADVNSPPSIGARAVPNLDRVKWRLTAFDRPEGHLFAHLWRGMGKRASRFSARPESGPVPILASAAREFPFSNLHLHYSLTVHPIEYS